MNISMNIECSPEEARRLMGLPDLQPLHQIYLDRVRETMEGGVAPELIENMMRAWGPIGDAGMNTWRQMMGQMTDAARG